jgi:PhnB protein
MSATTKQKAKSKRGAKPAAEARSERPQFPTVTPHLVCAGAADAIAFYEQAFGAREVMRLAGPDGNLWHACIVIGGSPVMLIDEFPGMGSHGPKALKCTPVTIHLTVDDADAWAERAVAAGARIIMPVEDAFWGDRYGIVEDPFGHRWSIAHRVRDLSAEEIMAAMPSQSDCGQT